MARASRLPVSSVFILLAVAAAFLFLMSHQETEAAAATSFEIDPASKEIGVASSSSVQLVAVPGPDSLAVWIVEIGFDPSIVTFNSCTSVPSPAGAAAGSGCEAKDTGGSPDDDTVVSFGGVIFLDNERGLDKETILATIKFDAVGAVGQCSPLTIDRAEALGPNEEEETPVIMDGEICIVEIGYAPAVVQGATWHLRNSNTGGAADHSFVYGKVGDTHLMCDWDGNGSETPAVVRGNTWYLRNSNSGGVADITPFTYGRSGDIPICGDWNDDGTETPGVIRGNTWYLRDSNSGGVADITPFTYGRSGDIALVGDWSGDGTDTPGVVQGNTWHLRNSNTGGVADIAFPYGRSGDIPLVWKASVPTQ